MPIYSQRPAAPRTSTLEGLPATSITNMRKNAAPKQAAIKKSVKNARICVVRAIFFRGLQVKVLRA